jgi:ketosteroid isomerase-like protein
MEPATLTLTSTEALDEIALVRAAFVDAVRHGDAAALAALYGEEATLVAPESAPLRGRADVAAFWQAGVESGITEIELEPEDVEPMATLAWEVGRYLLRLQPPSGSAVVERGRYLLVYRLDAGSWCRAAEMFAPESLS